MHKRDIYTLEGLSPEVRAVTFAKCSRSPESFRDIAAELTEEKSSKFHEKWVVGYGHSSVAEHAILSLAIENVSIIATKVIEDNRLASYTEKSTRYQKFDKNRYHKPENIMASDLGKLYEETGDFLFEAYEDLYEPVMAYVKEKNPIKDDQNEKLYEGICNSKVCDIIRYILPTATMTNLGMTVNARNLEHAIQKMLSNPLEEMKAIGQEIKRAATEACPTLIKYADANPYLMETEDTLKRIAKDKLEFFNTLETEPVSLIDYDHDAVNKIVTSLLYRYSSYPYQQIRERVNGMSLEEKDRIIEEALKRREQFDQPLREFEHVYYTFDMIMDYGAFRDVQRHRMCTQTNQLITADHGYSTPEAITEMGLNERYDEAMARAKECYDKLMERFPHEAQYIVPLAFKKRVLITWNLRELFHFIPLRSSTKGHISYRRIAQMAWDKLNEVHPLLARHVKVYR